jgi:uncharacterized protein (DUF488 family)
MTTKPPIVFTVGHSTRPIEAFIELLKGHSIASLVDVRTVPRSRHNPQFNGEALSESLHDAGIRYVHEGGLGGFRRPRKDSPNRGWRNTSFRGYADYMQTGEFAGHLAWLMNLARSERVAIMCSEAVPWRCHRSLIADALLVHGLGAEEIVDAARSRAHTLTRFARVDGTTLMYPAEEAGGP